MSGEDLPQSITAMLADYMSRVVPATSSATSRQIITNAYLAGVSGGLALVAISNDDLTVTMDRLADELEVLIAEKH